MNSMRPEIRVPLLVVFLLAQRLVLRIVISPATGHVTLSHSVAGLARLELVVTDFKGVRAG